MMHIYSDVVVTHICLIHMGRIHMFFHVCLTHMFFHMCLIHVFFHMCLVHRRPRANEPYKMALQLVPERHTGEDNLEGGSPLTLTPGTAGALQCVAICCSVLQCVAVCCIVLKCVAVRCSMLQCVAVCCSVLQCAVLC